MIDATKLDRTLPGSSEASYLSLALIDQLFDLLRERGVLSPDDIAGLLISAADRLGQNPSALAKRSAVFIRETMLPVHQVK